MYNIGAVVCRLAVRLIAGVVVLAILSPIAYIFWLSFAPGTLMDPPTREWSDRWYREFLTSSRWTRTLWTTIEVAIMSAGLSLIGGLGVALAVSRRQFWGRRLLSGVVLMPMFVPGVVLGLGLLPIVRWSGLWGSTIALASAHAVISLPVVYLLTRTALLCVHPDLERAARGLGACSWTAFRRITLPLISPAVVTGGVIAVVLSANEFIIAVFLATPRTRTLPAALWPEARDQETPLLAAASCLTVVATAIGMGLAGFAWRWASRRTR